MQRFSFGERSGTVRQGESCVERRALVLRDTCGELQAPLSRPVFLFLGVVKTQFRADLNGLKLALPCPE